MAWRNLASRTEDSLPAKLLTFCKFHLGQFRVKMAREVGFARTVAPIWLCTWSLCFGRVCEFLATKYHSTSFLLARFSAMLLLSPTKPHDSINNLWVHYLPLYNLKAYVWHAITHQKQTATLFKETKSDHYFKLILTPLFRELMEEWTVGKTTAYTRMECLWRFQAKSTIMCQEMCKEGTKPA